jgi:plastocyanin
VTAAALRRAGVATMVAALACAALPAQAGPPKRKTVTIGDNFYLPMKVTLLQDGVITWKWPDDSGDVHDVKLKERPKGAKGFWSDPAAVGYEYKQRLKLPGRYHIVCTLHEDMEMDIVVKRKPRRRGAG